jgi:hypothetical protein
VDLSYLRFAIESLLPAYVIHGTEKYLRFSKIIGTIYGALLRWASRESVDLSDLSSLLRLHAEEVDAGKAQP